MALLFFPVFPANPGSSPTLGQWILRFTILPLGAPAPFACTALGLLGISEIRRSDGNIVGLPLAFSVGVFYPIIILDAILFLIAAMAFSTEDYWNIALAVFLIVTLITNYFILKSAWREVNRHSNAMNRKGSQHLAFWIYSSYPNNLATGLLRHSSPERSLRFIAKYQHFYWN